MRAALRFSPAGASGVKLEVFPLLLGRPRAWVHREEAPCPQQGVGEVRFPLLRLDHRVSRWRLWRLGFQMSRSWGGQCRSLHGVCVCVRVHVRVSVCVLACAPGGTSGYVKRGVWLFLQSRSGPAAWFVGWVQNETVRPLVQNCEEFQGDDSREWNQEWAPLSTGCPVTAQVRRPRSRPWSHCLFSWFLKQLGLHLLLLTLQSLPGRLWRTGLVTLFNISAYKSTNGLDQSEGVGLKPKLTDAPGLWAPNPGQARGAERPPSLYHLTHWLEIKPFLLVVSRPPGAFLLFAGGSDRLLWPLPSKWPSEWWQREAGSSWGGWCLVSLPRGRTLFLHLLFLETAKPAQAGRLVHRCLEAPASETQRLPSCAVCHRAPPMSGLLGAETPLCV